MAPQLPRAEELFGSDNPRDLAAKADAFNEATVKSMQAGARGDFVPAVHIPGVSENSPVSALGALEKALSNPSIAKSIDASTLASLQTQVQQQREIVKDITIGDGLTTGSPIGTGLVPFDLEAPAKYLAPRPTPLRNKLPREKGQGTSRRFKRITGITGSGTGGVGSFHPGISETTQNNFAPNGASNALYLNRGAKISYAGDDKIVPYFAFGLSDSVSFEAQFAGQGFQDIRALSAQSLLYSSMLMEERMLLMGRGSNTSYFAGALSVPTATIANASPNTGESAVTGYTTNIWVKVTADAGDFGESASSTIASVAASAGTVAVVTISSAITGALGYRVYVGTGASAPADSALFYAGRTGSLTFRITGALPTSGTTVAHAVSTDTSAYANGYDGIMAYVTGSQAGYTKNLNSTFNGVSPGSEFQAAFASLYTSVKADPDEILFNGTDRKNLSELLKNSSSTNYRLTLQQDEIGNAVVGSVITAIQNEVTGKVVPMTVHPWMPQGNTAILSYSLPIPDSQVSNVWSVVNVQDYMGINWPVVDFQYQMSSYWQGTFVCYAPAWNGSITGIAVS
jgi:hypothetical protein